MVAVRFVPKEEFGSFVLVQVAASAFVTLSSLLLQSISATKFIASSDEPLKKEIANSSVSLTLLISIGILIIIVLCRPVIFYTLKSTALSDSFLIFLSFHIIKLRSAFSTNAAGFSAIQAHGFIQAINAIKAVLILLFLPFLGLGLTGLLYSFIISYMVSLLYQFFAIPVKKQFALISRYLGNV
jgi:O-antigen/teichoic acid export membrane protein